MEKAFGKVVNIKGNMAEVLIERGSMCGDSCSNCGMCDNRQSKLLVKNSAGAKTGDHVVLNVSTSKGLKAATLVYVVPVAILIIAVIILLNAGMTEETAVIAAFAIIAVWFLGVFVAEKKGAFKERISAEIAEIIKEA